MKNLNNIAEELFNKIRGRFPKVTIGDADSVITNEPGEGRFFDFEMNNGEKVNVSIDEDKLTVMYNNKMSAKDAWYDFLRELRQFSKKRMLDFDTRDITKANLDKSDYEYLSKERSGETTMSESKMYGTSRTSFQNIGNARMVVKHSAPVNQELASGRSQKIHSIYVENEQGERFKYPYKHLNGARAVARHVAEGGNLYDDIGQHIVGLSEELNKLRKFKTYMNRSTVMAEGLSGYMDVVFDRIATVKKTIESLQKENSYKQFVETFEPKDSVEVPEDVQSDWIDQLTIRQFNEELKDVFPYVYKLVSEANAVQELGPDELEEVAGPKDCWDGYKKDGTQAGTGKNKGKRVNKCVPEEGELEQGFEEMMGQFSETKAEEGRDINQSPEVLKLIIRDLKDLKAQKAKFKKGGYDEDVAMIQSRIDDILDIADIAKKGGYLDSLDTAVQDIAAEYYDKAGVELEGDEITLEKEQKTPLGEFILSYFDRESGQFPKGETAVLTMIEKDYGEKFIEPAKQFIEAINNKIAEVMGYKDAEVVESESEAVEFLKYLKQDPSYFPGADIEKTANGMVKILASNGEEVAQVDVKTGDIYLANGDDYNIADEENAEQTLQTMYAEINGKETDMEEAGYDDGGAKVLEKLLQGITKDFVNGDDSAAQEMVDMLKKHSPTTMDKVADMLEQQAKKLTKKTFGIFDNPLKKTPASNAADRMTILADYIRSKATQPAMQKEDIKLNDADKAVMQKLTGMIKQKQKEMQDARKGGYDEDVRMIASQLEDFYAIAELIQGKRPMGLDTSVMDLVHDMYDEVGGKFDEGNEELDRIRGLAGL